MNYFPSLDFLLSHLRIKKDDFKGSKKALVSADLLRLLVREALRSMPFDEAAYLAQNPDIAEAWKKGEIASLSEHFITYGYFEGRKFTSMAFDEKWYVSVNKDVAAGLKAGSVKSARVHYETIGEREGRAPSHAAVSDVAIWASVLTPKS